MTDVSRHSSPIASPHVRVVLVVVGLAALICLIEPLVQIPEKVSSNYNEGWNAHHATALMKGEPLYRPMESSVSTTYPPLSFLIVGEISGETGDALRAGRVVSFLMFLVVSICCVAIVWMITQSPAAGWFSGLLVLGSMGAHFPSYVAMNDPQFLGHAFQYLGLVLFIGWGDRRAAMVGTVLLLLAGGLVKHNLMPIPLAMTLWVYLYRRHDFVAWVAVALTALFLALAGLGVVFGPEMFESLFRQPRTIELWRLAAALDRWLVPLAPLMIGGVVALVLQRGGSRANLIGGIALVSFLTATLTSLVVGASVNAAFDLVLALAILGGIALHGASSLLTSAGVTKSDWVVPFVAAALSLTIFLRLPLRAYEAYETIGERDSRLLTVEEDFEFVAGRPGPLLSEDPAISYWAGRPFEVDMFTLSQKLKTGRSDGSRVLDRIVTRDYAIIQLVREGGSPFLSDAMNVAIDENYELARSSPLNGYYYVPRGTSASQ
jgi:hypothetical protein